LWTTYRELKDWGESPRGTAETYTEKYNELSDKHKKLVESLTIRLNIDYDMEAVELVVYSALFSPDE